MQPDFEGDARIGEVDSLAEHRRADGIHLGDRRIDQADDHVDVVDHQVEDDVDLDPAILPRRDAVALEIKRIGDDLGQRAVGAGEALDMADLKHPLSRRGEVCELAAGSTLSVSGFSTRTWMPASIRSRATS